MKYKLNRKKFMEWVCTSCYFEKHAAQIKDDLSKGGEYIITAEELLKFCTKIPSRLVDDEVEEYYVRGDECEFYYDGGY